MSFSLSDEDFEIECPNCDRSFDISVRDVGNTVTCPHCRKKIKLNDDGFSSGIRNVESQVDDLLKNFKF